MQDRSVGFHKAPKLPCRSCPNNGKITEKNHDLHDKCIKDKVLCFPHGHGSTVGNYVLYSLAKKNQAPKAIINQTADPVVVVGGIIAHAHVHQNVNHIFQQFYMIP